ncbi:MAG: AAA family ATPase, partial [Anaerolineae bacterium]|nr:AAA family ATPase [Anaerolineae bacterium]
MRIRRIAANDFKQLQSVDLHLPPVGRFLVQGKNEAGKSTLFEALYFGLFGKGLTGRGNEDLIGYAREKARVEIWVEGRDKLFKIERSLTRGKTSVSQDAYLTIEYPDGRRDTVNRATAVTKRLADEFGFNGEDLLNTCFVEQKKLDKLEGVDRQKREDSLMRLLNLDHLTTLERDFKITSEEKTQLEFLRQKVALGRIREELPRYETRLRDVEQELHLAAAREGLAQALAEYAEIDRLASEMDRLTRLEADLAQREAELDKVQRAGEAVRDLIAALEHIERERGNETRLRQAIMEVQTIAQELPDLERRAAALRRVASRLSRLDRVSRRHTTAQADAAQREREAQTLRERLTEQATTSARLAELTGQVEAANTRLDEAETALQASHERAALADWREAYLAATTPQRAQSELADRQAERGRLRQTFDTAIAAFLADPPSSAAALLAAVRALLQQLGDLFTQADTAAHRAGYLEGSYETLVQRAEADQKRLAMLEKRLRGQGAAVPDGLDAADRRLAGL